jgi:RNA polymerase sigma factor (sigma-70 family)
MKQTMRRSLTDVKIPTFEEIVLEYNKRLWHDCLRITFNNWADAEDLKQITWQKFYIRFFVKRLKDGQKKLSDIGNIGAYLKRMAKFSYYEEYRKDHPFINAESVDESRSAQQKFDEINLNERIDFDELIGSLSWFEQKIIRAYYRQGLSHEEIGQMLSLKVDAVKYRMAQAKEKIRMILEKRR